MSKVESIEDLLKQQTELQAKIEKIRSEEKSKVIEELKKQISIYNLVPSDLFEIKIPSGFFKAADEDEEGKRKRRTKEEKEAEEKAKHEKLINDAKSAFTGGIQVRKFYNEETQTSKYYWNGKKGIKPNGEGVVVKSIDEIE